ncbi:hypothetical protein N7510_002058 [Penicillium lagena]|uniref:uncharacterized protein n=1 Tax=Penicillium lagena TaxID=94218 RepID=UPI0025425FA5|nr:uncharacterized protein N7510_002058 [Penicillium lagena]KAJ5625749.1 hypothetical protein N7510_002058 [Penicillium lagena]
MAQFSLLSCQLNAVDPNAELEVGDTYLVRFKKPNKLIWIGVIIPEEVGPRRHTGKRPVGATPTNDGEWTTSGRARKYSVYLPGCNTYRWIGTDDMFTIEARPPSMKAELSDKPVAKLFRSILAIVKQKPSLQFWLDMIKVERKEKGDLVTTDLKLCVPTGYNIVLGEGDCSASKPLHPNKRTLGELSAQEPLSKVQASSNSFSTSRALTALNRDEFSGSAEQDDSLFVSPGTGAGTMNAIVANTDMITDPNGDMSTQTSATVHGFYEAGEPTIDGLQTPPVNPLSPEASMEVEVEVEAPNQPHRESIRIKPNPLMEIREYIFGTPVQDLVKTAFSNEFEILQNIEFVQAIVEMTHGPQGAFIRSFFETDDFCPRLILKNSEANAGDSDIDDEEQATLRIGDVRLIGTRYKLEDVYSDNVLHEHIIALGELYIHARRLRLDALIDKIVLKLQVAWNSYQGLSMLEDLLAVARGVFDAGNVSDSFDGMQNWVVAFLADIMLLFLYKYGAEFNRAMNGCPLLRNAVFEKYAKKLRESPERYANPLVWLRSRGVET